MTNILLTSAGRRAYIVDYFKSTNGIGKVFASNSSYTIALKRADGYLISPLIYDADYIPAIITYCKQNGINAVLSLFDIDLLVLARHAKDFTDNDIKLVLAPADFVEICNDKFKTYQYICQLGLLTPQTYIHIGDVKEAIASGILSYPIIIKPRWGMASIGIYKVYNEEELMFFSKRCYRDIFDSYLKYESSMTKDEAVIYQQMITGKEFGLDVLNDLNGNYLGTYAKEKVTMRSGETDLGRTADSSPFTIYGKKISQHSGHMGILSIDCFLTPNNEVLVTEMNCRISGHYPLSYLAGLNYPQLLVDWLNGKATDKQLLRFETGLYIVKDLCPTILMRE